MSAYWQNWVAYVPVLVAAALVLVRPLWPLTRHTVTLAHEAGHAVAALATGRQLSGIRLHSDSSGLTLSRGRPRGPGMVLTAAAGYLTPSLLGLIGAVLIGAGQLRVLLWGAVALMVVLLVFVRNVFGLVVLIVVGAVFGAVAYYGSGDAPQHFGYLAVWVLLLGNVRTVVEGAKSRSGHTDIDHLRDLTHLPTAVWTVLLIGIAVATGVLAWRVQYL